MDNIFAVNILRMWEKRGFTSHAGVLHPNEPVSQWIIPEKKQTGCEGGGGGGVEDILFLNSSGKIPKKTMLHP